VVRSDESSGLELVVNALDADGRQKERLPALSAR